MKTKKVTVLLSLRLEYWDKILEGVKKYELRRVFRKDAVDAFVYITNPVRAVCGIIEFDKPIIKEPKKIGKILEEKYLVKSKGVIDYLGGANKGYIIPIKLYKEIKPIKLDDLKKACSKFAPPQNYLILDNNPTFFNFLKEKLKKK